LRNSKKHTLPSEDEGNNSLLPSLLKSSYRARKEIRLTVNANVDWYGKETTKFLTLTFAEDIKDLKKANLHFMNFVKRMNRFLNFKLRYIAVVQFQDKTRGGVIHYHIMLFNVPFVPVSKITEIWGHGFVKINAIDDVNNVGAYMVGYMGKNLVDERLFNQKRFFRSKGLAKPTEVKGMAEDFKNFPGDFKKTFEATYENEYAGKIFYTQYRKKLDK